MTRRTRKSQSVAAQTVALAAAVPQVMAHRMTRMALAGPMPRDARDVREFSRMGSEKVVAFQQGWAAMLGGMWQTQASLMQTMMVAPWLAPMQLWQAWPGTLARGMAPVTRRATANARRLRRTPLR